MEKREDAETKPRIGRRLVLVPLPLQGHINPMLQLARILHSQGFSITIIHTRLNSPNSSSYPQFTFHLISDGLSETQSPMDDVVALVLRLNVTCLAPFRECLGRVLSEESVGCLISDLFCNFTQAVADEFKVPRIVLRTSGMACFLAFVAYPFLREMGFLPIQDSKLEEPLPNLPPLKVKDLPVVNSHDPESAYQFIASMVKETRKSSGLIFNSYEDLESSSVTAINQEFPFPSFPIGPFSLYFPSSSSSLLTQDRTCLTWLDKQVPNSVIYVSFGSIAAVNESEFLEIAWGLANSNQPFLWVVRPGLVRGSEWLEPLPNGFLEEMGGRAHIVKWAPQQEVLAHGAIGAFGTHCGWNSVIESICEGVPMICLPCFGDQNVNARYVNDVWRVGLHLEGGLEREKIESAIKKVMLEREGREMRERVTRLKETTIRCVKEGGSSYRSLKSLVCYILSL